MVWDPHELFTKTLVAPRGPASLDSRLRAGLSGERINELWLHAKRHLGLVVSFWLKRLRKEGLACATKIRCLAIC